MVTIYRTFIFHDWRGRLAEARGEFATAANMPEAYEIAELVTGARPSEFGGALTCSGFHPDTGEELFLTIEIDH